MYLATVTCNRDFQQILLQAESIMKFVNPCKHVIIVNEENPDIDFWYRWLKPYYNNHELILRPRINYAYPHSILGVRNRYGALDKFSSGWRSQQLQKMLLAYEYNDDYLLLDSKNFFLKQTDINEWNIFVGGGRTHKFKEPGTFWGTSKKYVELFGFEIEDYLLPSTPFMIKREPLISKCTFSELGYKLFYPEHYNMPASEGIFYSFFVDELIKEQKGTLFMKSITVWAPDMQNLHKRLFEMSLQPDIKVGALHREVLSALTEIDMKIINYWLNDPNNSKLKFKNKIYPMPKDSHI